MKIHLLYSKVLVSTMEDENDTKSFNIFIRSQSNPSTSLPDCLYKISHETGSRVQRMRLIYENLSKSAVNLNNSSYISKFIQNEKYHSLLNATIVKQTNNKFTKRIKKLSSNVIPQIFKEDGNEIFTSDSESDNSYYYSETKGSEKICEARNNFIILKNNLTNVPNVTQGITPDIIETIHHLSRSKSTSECSLYALNSTLNANIAENNTPQPVEELILTEENYVATLKNGIRNYLTVFNKENTPPGLRGKRYFLFGNIEQIADFHENIFLPMLLTNKYDIPQLCQNFIYFIEKNYFYAYVLYTTNKIRSEKQCLEEKNFFQNFQNAINDKLGINSLLMQPIQRLPRYLLIIKNMISKFFIKEPFKYKTTLAACCKLEKSLSSFLQIVNEAVNINDISDCTNINLMLQGCFKKCEDFYVYDYTQRRGYRSKVFAFEKCFVYTEILRDKKLTLRGTYTYENIGFLTNKKYLTLYYRTRKQQKCSFYAETHILNLWIEIVRDMMTKFAKDEKQKLLQKYCKNSHIYRRSIEISPFRSPSQISNDSGISFCG